MSQSALRRTKKGEEVYCELLDDSGFNIAWGVGHNERVAADQAEIRWRRDFPNIKPIKKTLWIRHARILAAQGQKETGQ